MGKSLWRLLLLVSLLGMILMADVTTAMADDREIDSSLESVDPPDKDTTPTDTEEATGGGLDGDANPGGANPGGADPGTGDPNGPGGDGGSGSDGNGGAGSGGGGSGSGGNGGSSSGGGGTGSGGGPGGANPGDGDASGADGGDGANPGDGDAGGADGNGGANPGDGDAGGADGNGGANPGDGDAGGADGNGGANPGDGDAGGADGNGGTTGSGGADPAGSDEGGADEGGGSNPGGADPDGSSPGDGGDGEGGKSWWESVGDWFASDSTQDFLNKLGRGLLVGLAGAAIVLGVVAVAALVLGLTISAPVWIIAAAAGIVAGVIYSFVSGDAFNFLQGIAVSALASLSVFAFAYAGIGTAVRTAVQFLRTSGFGGLGGLIRTAAQGAWTGVRAIMSRGFAANLAALGRSLFSANVGIQFGLGNLISFAAHVATKGTFPTLRETGEMVLENALGALVFGKIVDGITGNTASKLTTRVTNFVVSMAESAVGNLYKGDKKDAGSMALDSFLKATVIGPVAAWIMRSRLFHNIRISQGAGLTIDDIKTKYGVDVSVVPGQKTITNKQLMQLLSADPNNLTRSQTMWLQDGTLSQRQLDMLMQNQEAFEQFASQKQFALEKVLESTSSETSNWVNGQNGAPNLSK